MTHPEYVEQLAMIGLDIDDPIVTLTTESVAEVVDDLLNQGGQVEVAWKSLSANDKQARQLTSVITVLRKIPKFARS